MSNELQDKVILITGATSGIGQVAARDLAIQGATVVILARDPAKAQRVRDEIVAVSNNPKVDVLLCDLASLSSIQQAAAFFKTKYQRLDVLINNAGGIFGNRQVSPNGYEMTFALNQLAYFYLTDQLLDLLLQTAASNPVRIVNVASEVARYAKLDWNNLQGERKYNAMGAYAVSKLCNILYSFKLAEELRGTGVSVNCLHPGAVATNFGDSGGTLIKALTYVSRPFMLTAEQGADTLTYLASSPAVEGLTGKFYMHRRAANPPAIAYTYHLQQRLWATCEHMVRLALGPDAIAYKTALANTHVAKAQDSAPVSAAEAPAKAPSPAEALVSVADKVAKSMHEVTTSPIAAGHVQHMRTAVAEAPAINPNETEEEAAERRASYDPIDPEPMDPEMGAFNQE